MPETKLPPGLTSVTDPVYAAGSRVLTVGVNKMYGTVSAAVAASIDGDVILVDAGTYRNDFVSIYNKVTLIGVGGMVNMVATEPPPNLKGIIKVDNDATIQNFTFSGAAISQADGGNAAGIRYEGGQLTLVNDAFIGNQNGIMGNPEFGSAMVNTITIDHSLFSGNGGGTGNTHNVYIGGVDSLVATNSVFENAVVGHEFKSRALSTTVEDNIFRDGPTGTASYDIDLPNGGVAVIRDNLIEKGPQAENNAMVHFGGEGLSYAGSSLLIEGNTFVNDKGANTVALLNHTAVEASVTGNTFVGIGGDKVASGPASVTANTDASGNAVSDSHVVTILPGSTYYAMDADPHAVSLSTNTLKAVQGGEGRLTISSSTSFNTVIGGRGGIDFTEAEASGYNQTTTAAGSVNTITAHFGDLVNSQGTDRILGEAGNYTVQVRGTAVADDGMGSNTWTVLGTASITGHGGNPIVNVGASGNAAVDGTLHYLQMLNNGGTASVDATIDGATTRVGISGGAVNLRAFGGNFELTTGSGTANGATITLGDSSAKASVFSKGRDVVRAGAGAAQVILSGEGTVYAGTGELSIWGRMNTSAAGGTVYGNGGSYLIDGDGGNITYYGGDKDSTVIAHLSKIRLVGGAGRLTVLGGASGMTVTGGSGGLTYDAQGVGGGNTISTAAGVANSITMNWEGVVDSWGRDTILGGGGNSTFTLHGDAVLTGSTGSSKVTMMGNDTLIGRGQDTVTVTQGANATITTGWHTYVHQTGATVNYTIAGGTAAAAAVVTGGAAWINGGTNWGLSVETDLGSTGTDIRLSGGYASVVTNGTATLHAGGGPVDVTIKSASNEIWAGSGTMRVVNSDWALLDPQTIHGGSGTLSYVQGPGALRFIGGSGDATIDGQYGSLDIQAGSGTTVVNGGQRGLHFVAGTGASTINVSGASDITMGAGDTTVAMTIWSGAATLRFTAGHGGGTDVVTGFRVGQDRLVLDGVSVTSQSVSGGAANLVLSDGTHLQLAGVASTAHLFG